MKPSITVHRMLILFLCGHFCMLQAFTICGHAGNQAEILIPEHAEPSTLLAAKELTDYVEKICGKKLTTVRGSSQSENQIVIGTLKTLSLVPEAIRTRLDSTGKIETSCLLATTNRLYIVGKRRVAELFGVYAFLENDLGVRWFKTAMPDDPGEFVPKKTELIVPQGFRTEEPFFTCRRLDQCSSYGTVEPERGKIWAARNRFQISGAYSLSNTFRPEYRDFYAARTPDWIPSAGGHTTFSAAISDQQVRDHPEYLPLIDGKRVLLTPGGCRQHCITNPQVQQLVLNQVDSIFATYGADHVAYLFGMPDTSTGWCECPGCRELDGSSSYDNLNISTRFHKVSAELAARIYEKHPDAHLRLWAYHTYRQIPRDVTLDPRIELVFCIHGRCYGHRLDDPTCPRNAPLFNLLKEWQKLARKTQIYEYTTATPPYYAPLELRVAHDLKLYQKLGLTGWKEEAAFPDSRFYPPRKQETRQDIFPSTWQGLYVASKLLWNPELDATKVLEDAESTYYGKAYPAMKNYHDLRRKLWENTAACMGYPTGDQRTPDLLNAPESRQQLEHYLQKARELARGDKILTTRINWDSYYLTNYWIKPHEAMKLNMSRTFSAPSIRGSITIDGKGEDPDWVHACYVKDFFETFTAEKNPIPQQLQTTVGILSDKENLYFLIKAREPKMSLLRKEGKKDGALWQEDSVEVFIMPPNAAKNYYHVIANAGGAVYDAVNPGNDHSLDLGVQCASQCLPDQYVVELKVPVKHMGDDFRRGSLWRIHFARNRTVEDELNRGSGYSIDGEPNHNTSGYRSLEIGTPLLRNGSLDDVKDGQPTAWIMEKGSLVHISGGYAVKLDQGGRIYQLLTDRELWQAPGKRTITVTYKTWGKGSMSICFYHYKDTQDGKAPHGYRREFLGSTIGKTIRLSKTPQIVTVSYEIPADQWCGLALHGWGDETCLDDVALKLKPQIGSRPR